jgi:hypothetical protein
MQLNRPAFAPDPRRFGRGSLRDVGGATAGVRGVSGDLKLFATTFLAGFLFVSILIG